MSHQRVCLIPRLQGVGGMASFQGRLATGMERRGIEVVYDLGIRPLTAVLVIGGTRRLGKLWRTRQDGIPVVQRLNGMNWLHRLRRTGLRHYLRAEYGNLLLSFIRSRIADRVVYQSRFAKSWWDRVYKSTGKPATVVYNAVDLSVYTPEGQHNRPDHLFQVLMVEGNLGGGYELGLEWGVTFVEHLQNLGFPAELVVAGKVSQTLREVWLRKASIPLQFAGLVKPQDIPEIDRSAHLMFSADIHPACPNSVIEALACGLPVAGLDTGALAELVQDEAGVITDYGGDSWKLDPPNLQGLAQASARVLENQHSYRAGARRRAESEFSLDKMVDGYLKALGLLAT